MNYLEQVENLEAFGGGAVVKLTNPGDAVVARFVNREEVITKMGPGKRLSIEVVESNIAGVEPGPAVVFESGHITQIMDNQRLVNGQAFALKLVDVDKKTRFKRFGFSRVPALDDVAPPDWEPGSD